MSGVTSVGVGNRVVLNDQVWLISEVHDASVTLRHGLSARTILAAHLLSSPDLRVLPDHVGDNVDREEAIASAGAWTTLASAGVLSASGINEAAQTTTLARVQLVQRFLTGYPNGIPLHIGEEPDPRLGPGAGSLTVRRQRLANELGVSTRQAHTLVTRFQSDGPLGLVDQRKAKLRDPLAGCPPELRAAIIAHLEDAAFDSKLNLKVRMKILRRTMAEQQPDVPLPQPTAFRGYINALARDRGIHLSGKTRRGAASRGSVTRIRTRALRPFDRVQIDATPLDTLAWYPDTNRTERVTLLTAVDVCSRSIVAWRVIPEKEGRVDVSLLLYQMMIPKIVPAAWGPLAQWRYGVPQTVVIDMDQVPDDQMLAGIPHGIPTSVLVDWGRVNVSADVLRVAQQLGITIEMARKAKGSDKGHVERSFRTINGDFAAQLPGYAGSSVHDRGDAEHVEEQAALTVEEIEDRFGRWVATVYHNTPHRGLPIPGMPGKFFTPNEAFDLATASTGILRVLADRNTAISLLPSTMCPLHHYGIEFEGIRYNSPELQLQAGMISPLDPDKGRWPVRWDPRDRSLAWVWQPHPEDPRLGQWLEVPSTTLTLSGPMSQARWNSVRRHLQGGRTETPTPEQVQAAEDALMADLPRSRTSGRAARQKATSDAKVAAAARDRARFGDPAPTAPPLDDSPLDDLDFQRPGLYEQIGEDAGYDDEEFDAEGGLA